MGMLWLLSRRWDQYHLMVALKLILLSRCTFSQDSLQTQCNYSSDTSHLLSFYIFLVCAVLHLHHYIILSKIHVSFVFVVT